MVRIMLLLPFARAPPASDFHAIALRIHDLSQIHAILLKYDAKEHGVDD